MGREGLLHIRLVGAWKLVAGGSFALDTQALEINTDGNNRTQVVTVPALFFFLRESRKVKKKKSK